ncbi:MAG: hypothetical protein IIC33_09900 [Chloroflexi bacterium]|nr:hypothetical protein [Chloroflexota bacterium]
MNRLKELAQYGLYSPQFEHDGCGVGVVANIKGGKSHQIIDDGLKVLVNLGHRGAAGCDPETGDGAGILIQMPHQFFQAECDRLQFTLPDAGEYGVGMLFLPPQPQSQEKCRALVDHVIKEEGLELLGWRDVPVDRSKLGRDAREVCPHISQVFVGQGPDTQDSEQLERKLYVVRKVIEHTALAWGLTEEEADFFYVCSLSTKVLVYKGQLMSEQVVPYYPDLADVYQSTELPADSSVVPSGDSAVSSE